MLLMASFVLRTEAHSGFEDVWKYHAEKWDDLDFPPENEPTHFAVEPNAALIASRQNAVLTALPPQNSFGFITPVIHASAGQHPPFSCMESKYLTALESLPLLIVSHCAAGRKSRFIAGRAVNSGGKASRANPALTAV
jgi:hypothetical protein